MLNLNIGDKLYCVHYWTCHLQKSKREIESKKIKKVNKKTVQLSWYYNYKIKIDSINKDKWFTSEIKALENALKLHREVSNKSKEILKEINTLKKMIEYRKGDKNGFFIKRN
jgi:hypothetical protein